MEQVEAILEIASQFLAVEFEVRESYSGRGMYGDSVIAITGDSDSSPRDLSLAIGIAIGQDQVEEEATNWFMREDSMGRGWVAY